MAARQPNFIILPNGMFNGFLDYSILKLNPGGDTEYNLQYRGYTIAYARFLDDHVHFATTDDPERKEAIRMFAKQAGLTTVDHLIGTQFISVDEPYSFELKPDQTLNDIF